MDEGLLPFMGMGIGLWMRSVLLVEIGVWGLGTLTIDGVAGAAGGGGGGGGSRGGDGGAILERQILYWIASNVPCKGRRKDHRFSHSNASWSAEYSVCY